ncbi:proline-rich receptor-like protein kinase PERK8 [Iris pallida]|uniref:Proline-rich receptor-like protein kinase PERK8 n=1 Tax=Iris pallida TaxID=29817 RepID=A0AAX6HB68_IRIPA|nr:proline-rich receptor-like protein kinase PERK8 [Iris pallida]KAJ6844857.1 proline-rich receptor-like protein kinase PERK8 [Iris pallida]
MMEGEASPQLRCGEGGSSEAALDGSKYDG